MMKNKNLEDLLKDWHRRRSPDETHLRLLRGRIIEDILRDQPDSCSPHVVRKSQRLATALRRRAVAAIAVSLLIAAVAVFALRHWRFAGQGAIMEMASISNAELGERARLFQEVERLFDDELRWVANAEAGMQMGIRPVCSPAEAEAGALLIRVVVLAKHDKESSWHEILKTDVLMRSEELVELPDGPKAAGRLALWTHRLPDGKVVVDSKLALTGPMRVSINASNVLNPGEPAQIFRLKTGDDEYRVLQVVVPLPKRKDLPCFDT